MMMHGRGKSDEAIVHDFSPLKKQSIGADTDALQPRACNFIKSALEIVERPHSPAQPAERARSRHPPLWLLAAARAQFEL
jgi:hypothetical protein